MFGIKLIFARSELYVATFCICIDVTVILRYKSVVTICSLKTQQIAVRLVEIKSAFYRIKPMPLFHCSRTPPLNISTYINTCKILFIYSSQHYKPNLYAKKIIWLKLSINYSLFQLNFKRRHFSAISLIVVMLRVFTKRVCVW